MINRIGIFWKYFIAYSTMATVVIFILAAVMDAAIRDANQELILGELKKYALFAETAFREVFEGIPEGIQEQVKALGRRTEARITLIQTNGIVLADSDMDPALMENHSERPEIKKALSGDVGTSIRYSTTVKKKMNYVAVPVVQNKDVTGVVRVSLELKSIELLMWQFTRRIVFISMGLWAIALLLTLLFSSFFSSSIRHMVGLTKRIADENFSRTVIIRSRDELGDLAAGLNSMSKKLQSTFDRLRTQHDELDSIIRSMTEGVLVLDHDLRIRLANNSLMQIFSIEGNAIDRSYIEAIRLVALKEIVDDLLEYGEIKNRRMGFDDKILLVNGVTFTSDKEDSKSSVLVFHDITSDIHLERLKAEFVENASHELRTPLAVLSGYLETFENEDPETQKGYIQVIRKNVNRISNLVSDLLLLSNLESSAPGVIFEKVDLSSLANSVMKLVARSAQNKGIMLETDIGDDVYISGDPFLLEQVLLNLLDNAIKYAEHGKVVLRGKKSGKGALIQVSDTGVGIPEQDLSRIFERFYMVDKARSRDLGGTGLGLSIVKHIVQLHGGKVEVESQLGVGTTFTIYLPGSENAASVP